MKTKLFGILLFFLATIGLSACDDDDTLQDKVSTIKMLVSSAIGSYTPWDSDIPIDCMLVKEENDAEYKTLEFSGIINFKYQEGHEYTLIVEKTILANPPADGSNIVYKLIEIVSESEVKYEYIIKSDAPNPFVLTADGGKYEIPFTCKKRKYVNGELAGDEYAALKGLKYSTGNNYGGTIYVIKDGEQTGYYRFIIEGALPFNMNSAPWWYYGIYPANSNLVFGPEPEPIFKQLLEQPQTEGDDYFIYPFILASTATFDI